MARLTFRERLQQNRPILADGAMGTALHQAGMRLKTCYEHLNLTDPALVASVHRQYIEAGAELIETNTFGANDYKLKPYGLEQQTIAINESGVELAQRVAKASFRDDIYIAGAVGPLGVWVAPLGRVSEESAFMVFRRQMAALIFGGVDAILLETFTDVNELTLAVKAARDVRADIPIVAQMTFTRDDRTVLGDAPATVAKVLAAADVDVIGVNCSSGPAQLLRLSSIIHSVAPDKKLAAQPNAGYPELLDGRTAYPASPDYFGDYALAFADAGVTIIGGCCGTTAGHIAAMRKALDDPQRPHVLQVAPPKPFEIVTEAPIEQPTRLAQKLATGEFITTVEIAPPKNFTDQRVVAAAEMLREAGIEFVNVSDAPLARMRMSPWAVAFLIQERVGMECVLHFPVRGRNLLRVQGDLLAAHALNIRNVFVTMGDPNKIGDYPDSFDTHDVVPTGLISLIHNRLNQGIDQSGSSIGHATRFTIGGALTIGAPNLEKEIALTRKKIDNGVDFLLTQPIFEPQKAHDFLAAYADFYGEPLGVPIIAGVLPLFTPRHAAFLHNEVPGIIIPPKLQARMENASDPAAEGVRIAQEILLELRETVQGAYFMPPFGRYYLAAEVVEVLQKTGV